MKRSHPLNYLALGVALGAGVGVAMHNLAIGVAFGLIVGAAFSARARRGQ